MKHFRVTSTCGCSHRLRARPRQHPLPPQGNFPPRAQGSRPVGGVGRGEGGPPGPGGAAARGLAPPLPPPPPRSARGAHSGGGSADSGWAPPRRGRLEASGRSNGGNLRGRGRGCPGVTGEPALPGPGAVGAAEGPRLRSVRRDRGAKGVRGPAPRPEGSEGRAASSRFPPAEGPGGERPSGLWGRPRAGEGEASTGVSVRGQTVWNQYRNKGDTELCVQK